MIDWLGAAGVIPVTLPAPADASYDEIVARIDGLVLQGGVDIAPTRYGEQPRHPDWATDPERDAYEIGLLDSALRTNKPVLAICRGHQLLNVALGGSLHQDIATDVPESLEHRNAERYEANHHDVELVSQGRLHTMYGHTSGRINSVHHQAIRDLGAGLRVEARSADGIIEAVSMDSPDNWVLGLQWHPEFQRPIEDAELLPTGPISDAFVRAIRENLEQ